MAHFVPDDPGRAVLPDQVVLEIVRSALASEPRTAASLRLACRRLDQLCCKVLWERFQAAKQRYAGSWLVERKHGQGDCSDVIHGTVCVLWVAVRRFVEAGICPFFMFDALRLAEKRSLSSLQVRGRLMRAASYALNHFFRSLQERTWSNVVALRRSRPLEAVALLDVLRLCSAVRIQEDSLEEDESQEGLARARFSCLVYGIGFWAYDIARSPKREPVYLQDLLDFVCFFVAQRNIDLTGAEADEWVAPNSAMFTELHTTSDSVLFRVDCDESYGTVIEVDLICWKGFLIEEECETAFINDEFCLDISISPAPGTPSLYYKYRVTLDKVLRVDNTPT